MNDLEKIKEEIALIRETVDWMTQNGIPFIKLTAWKPSTLGL